MPPLLITFEGIDGSGKSPHLKRAAEGRARHGVACRQTHEPGGTPLGDALRLLFLDHRWGAPRRGGPAAVAFCPRPVAPAPRGAGLRLRSRDPGWGAFEGPVDLLMLCASRRQHLLEVIEPALAAGEI